MEKAGSGIDAARKKCCYLLFEIHLFDFDENTEGEYINEICTDIFGWDVSASCFEHNNPHGDIDLL